MSVIESFCYRDLEAVRVGRFNLGVNTTFIVYRLGGTVIDTGPSNQWRQVSPFIRQRQLNQLLLTHHHEDHSGNAGAIYRLTGVQPTAPALTVEILRRGFRIPPIQRLIWGTAPRVQARPLPEEIRIGTERVEPLRTPGHAKDMVCYLLPDRGWLFSADLYIANYLKMLRSDEDVSTLLESIRAVLARDFAVIICPHRGVVENGRARLREKYDYLVDLACSAQELYAGGLPPKAIVHRLLGREELVGLASRYNFSKRNLIESCLRVDLSLFPPP